MAGARRTTVVAHSYGTVVVDEAADAPGDLAADAVVLLGSPGMEDDAASLEAPEVFDAASPGDPIAWPAGSATATAGGRLRGHRPCRPTCSRGTPDYFDPGRPTLAAIGEVVAGTRRPGVTPTDVARGGGEHRAQAGVGPGDGAPTGVVPGAVSGPWLTVARRGGVFLGRRPVDRPPASPGTTAHHRQEHRAHEDHETGSESTDATAGGTKVPARKRTAASGGKPLVIVESPTKANKIAGYLGSGYVVEASVGHIRDLPRNAADVPAEHKGAAWARLGVDVDNSFEPLYVVSPDRKQQVSRLKQLMKDASEVYLATDEDREGEAIAWHLVDTLKPRVPVHRMVFHEITPEAIARAVANPRELDTALVDAQETRRILDRLYGYEVSPVLWKKVLPKLSAGRVQSVATRIVVERERERMALPRRRLLVARGHLRRPAAGAPATDAGEPTTVRAKLVSVDDSRVATGRDFDAGHRPGHRRRRPPRRGRRPRARRPARGPPGHASAGSTRSPTGAVPTRRSPPRRCRWTPAASSAGPRRRRCGWRSGCTRTATSPTCVPTRRTCRRRRSTPPGSRPASCTATPTSRPRRAATRARPRARRRRTRRSAPPVTTSGRPGSWPRSWPATSSGSTS